MAPGYLTQSIGLEYKPVDYFWIRFGAGTIRQTFILDREQYKKDDSPDAIKNYGVSIGKKVRNEVAFQFISNFDKDIMTNINLKVRYMMFANYELLNSFNNIDQRVDLVLTAKVNKYISTSLTGLLIYDRNQDKDAQISQVLAIGIVYKLL